MTTRDETALAIAQAVNDWMLDAETTAPFLVSEEEELARTIEPLLVGPPAPAAITEAQIEAAARAIYERQSWETRNHWDDLDDIERDEWIADAQVALAAAQAQPGGERNKE